MKRFAIAFLAALLSILAGCGTGPAQERETEYTSDTSAEDCCLCGGGIEDLVSPYWGQNNVALISLNTFEIRPVEINRYDSAGRPIEEYTGAVTFGGCGGKDGGFFTTLMLNCDRGYAVGSVDFRSDEILDAGKAASFLCADCLNEILSQKIGRCFGVGVIHLDTKEIRLFEENVGGFGLGDFYIDYQLERGRNSISHQADLFICCCPIRYEKT